MLYLFIDFHMFPQLLLKGLPFGWWLNCPFTSDKSLLTRQVLAPWKKYSNAKQLIFMIDLWLPSANFSVLSSLHLAYSKWATTTCQNVTHLSLYTPTEEKNMPILTTTKMSDNSTPLYFSAILCKSDICFQNILQPFIFLFKCF